MAARRTTARRKVAAVPDPVGTPIGVNVIMDVDGDMVSLVMDLTADHGPTSTGKNRRVATTSGNTSILAGLKLGVNLYDPIPARESVPMSMLPDQPDTPIGSNLVLSVDGGVATITFDSGQDLGPTTSGKGRRVAMTGGNITIAGGLKLGINCYDPVPAERV